MKTGILESLQNLKNLNKVNNKIPEYAKEYKREYQCIIGINKEFKYFVDNLDKATTGLFESHRVDRIKYFIKRFLRAQEKGKIKEINELFFWKNDILDIIEFYYEVKPNFSSYNLDLEFILIFDKFYDKINFNYYDWEGNIKVKECIM